MNELCWPELFRIVHTVSQLSLDAEPTFAFRKVALIKRNSCKTADQSSKGIFWSIKGEKCPFFEGNVSMMKKSGMFRDLSKTEKILKRLRKGQRRRGGGGNC